MPGVCGRLTPTASCRAPPLAPAVRPNAPQGPIPPCPPPPTQVRLASIDNSRRNKQQQLLLERRKLAAMQS